MTFSDTIRGTLIGIILIAVGWAMVNSANGIKIVSDMGWIFSLGGIAVTALSVYTVIRR